MFTRCIGAEKSRVFKMVLDDRNISILLSDVNARLAPWRHYSGENELMALGTKTGAVFESEISISVGRRLETICSLRRVSFLASLQLYAKRL